MAVSVVLPAALRDLAGGRRVIEVAAEGRTVAAALAALRDACPAVHRRVVAEDGSVRPHVNLFVGRDDVRHVAGLETPVPDGAEVVILPSISGG